MRLIVLLLGLGALLGTAVVLGVRVWMGMSGVDMPWQGWLALAGGVVLALALGIGLMFLVFYSARRGHDEAHHDQRDYRPPPPPHDEGRPPPGT